MMSIPEEGETVQTKYGQGVIVKKQFGSFTVYVKDLDFNIKMELFAARMVRSIIDQIVYTKNTENQCFLRNKKVDSGPLELKGKKSSSKIMLVNTYP